VQTHVLDRELHCPAASVCTRVIQGDPENHEDVYRFGQTVDMVTFEIEHVNVAALKRLKGEGKSICPDPVHLAVIQDKGRQKQFYAEHGIPTAPFALHADDSAIREAVASGELRYPFVQKLREGGYDGRGVAVIDSEAALANLLPGPSVVEERIDLQKEISVIAARNAKGQVRCFPVVGMDFNAEANLVERLVCPSAVGPEVSAEATRLAEQVINAFQLVGLLAVEMFFDRDGKVWVNEVAPRPHNSGHHTIESIVTSQFEQMLRALFNFPLGSTMVKLPAVMINLLGEPGCTGKVKYEGLTESLAIDGVKVHLYGKKQTRPFRKMGHVTVVAATLEEARAKADLVKQKLKVKAW
jgi:5-(carboxyamino)imidazole ribonucleotide synthase